MPQILVETQIDADIKICFDLARDVGFYKNSLKEPTEIPISGKISGLVEKGDYVTWETNHLNLIQHLTLKVTAYDRPFLFVDEMVRGEFKSYRHEHIFETCDGCTRMIDKLYFESSYGILGKITDKFLLKRHMTKLLITRNALLKQKAEELFNIR
ncbi:SRPBCC family protein [Winogradskyella flava]|uniref:SRPBCC family protein n=1 Tax=Winogradskyella flava TaxID=1884876 RepID=A0A842IQH0_9FLAO|nr:SRPBCC family protein [Winogradskyella flava]MBC2844965.1 SRPBCC family protein [Winogradskyella flava]